MQSRGNRVRSRGNRVQSTGNRGYGAQELYFEATVLIKPYFGRLISHCRKHPNLRLVQLAIEGNPYVLLQTIHKMFPGEELMYDYGDRTTGLEDFMKYNNCICSKCAK